MYKRRTAAELKEMCEERGLACSGLKKAQMIELLEKYDDECRLVESNSEEGTPEHREDVGMHEGGDDNDECIDDGDRYSSRGAAEPSGGQPRSQGPDSINETLRLRLALKEAEIRAQREAFEIEKERMQLRGATGNSVCNLPVVDNNVVNNDLFNRSAAGLRLPVMRDGDEIVGFFHSFEKACTLNGVTDKSTWCRLLPSCLTPKTYKIVERIPTELCTDYEVVKSRISEKCQQNAETFLNKFRTLSRTGNQTYVEFLTELEDVYAYYLKAKKIETYDQLLEDNVMNQMLESIRIPQIRAFCESKQPKCASEVAQYCDLASKIYRREKAAIAANQGREPVMGTKPSYGPRTGCVAFRGASKQNCP